MVAEWADEGACSGESLDAVLRDVEEDALQLLGTALAFDEAFAQGVALPASAFCAELSVKLCSDQHIRGESHPGHLRVSTARPRRQGGRQGGVWKGGEVMC
jgi:hypothetical protein